MHDGARLQNDNGSRLLIIELKPLKRQQKEVESVSIEALKALFVEPDLKKRTGRCGYAFSYSLHMGQKRD